MTTRPRWSMRHPAVFTKWRVDSLFTKEPDTIEWIRGFQAGEVFVDIGANVGMYTIWAAKTRGVRTFAFEPESQNYALLCRNIVMNELSERVVAYCLALSDSAGYSLLHLSQFQLGGSCHSFGEKIDHNLEHRDTKLSQGCVSTHARHAGRGRRAAGAQPYQDRRRRARTQSACRVPQRAGRPPPAIGPGRNQHQPRTTP